MHTLHSLLSNLKKEFVSSRKGEERGAWFVYTLLYFTRARFAVFRKVETAGLAMSVDLLYGAYGYVPDSQR